MEGGKEGPTGHDFTPDTRKALQTGGLPCIPASRGTPLMLGDYGVDST